jgi:hypothetical protein
VNRFNLTFRGEILAGKDPAAVKLGFGKMFAVDDPVQLEHFFSGETIVLRRNLERKEAAKYYHEMQVMGAGCALVKVTAGAHADTVTVFPPSAMQETAEMQAALTEQLQTAADTAALKWHKHQSGKPNLYKLRPFRNSDEVRNRSARAHQLMHQSYALGAIALLGFFLAGWGFLGQPTEPIITGADAVAIDHQSRPVLLAGDFLLLHDRSGISTGEVPLDTIGLNALEPPMAFDSAGKLFALGSLTIGGTEVLDDTPLQLLRCDLRTSNCQRFLPDLEEISIDAFVINPVDGNLLLIDTSSGLLFKANPDGKVLARAELEMSTHPVLRLHAGLLLINSAYGTGIRVFRYETSAFAQQLDEIPLLPPAAREAKQSVVSDFVWSGGVWWASLSNPESGSTGLYRFDEDWNYLQHVLLPIDNGTLQLTSWGEKTLVNNSHSLAIQRLSAQGTIEAPLISSQLKTLISRQQQRARLATAGWLAALLICGLGVVVSVCTGYLQRLRRFVYKSRQERGAEPLDDYANSLHWIDPMQNRPALLRRRRFRYGLLALAAILLSAGQTMTAWPFVALLIALSGPAAALLLLERRPVGHIGIWQDRLLLVDHTGMYHFAGGSDVQYRGHFLLIDDIVVFCGSHLLPVFPEAQIEQLITPMMIRGTKVDRNTLAVKLLQARHPLAQGAMAVIMAAAAAISILCLEEIF